MSPDFEQLIEEDNDEETELKEAEWEELGKRYLVLLKTEFSFPVVAR